MGRGRGGLVVGRVGRWRDMRLAFIMFCCVWKRMKLFSSKYLMKFLCRMTVTDDRHKILNRNEVEHITETN